MNALALVAPWALAGLALVALPIAIHLMGRTPARPFKFPSLRFVTPSQVLPRRRARIEDPLLLVLRVAAIAAAAVALAAPAFRGAAADAASGSVATVALVDTSASVLGAMASTVASAADRSARIAELTRIADSAIAAGQSGIVLRTATPARELAGAASWLTRHDAQREIVIVSDFQAGTLDSAAVAALPAGTVLRFRRVATRPLGSISSAQGGAALEASVVGTAGGVEATWTRRGAVSVDSSLKILAAASDGVLAAALLEASRTAGVGTALPGVGPIAVVLPSEPTRSVLESSARPVSAGWQRRIVAMLATDQSLFAAAPASRPPFAAAASSDGNMLLIFAPTAGDAASVLTLVTAVRRAAADNSAAGELAAGTDDDATLARWNAARDATPAPVATAGQPLVHGPATRWLWIAALVLLGLEWVVRRRVRS